MSLEVPFPCRTKCEVDWRSLKINSKTNSTQKEKMSLLHRLPMELCQAVPLLWLDLVDVAHLDSAVCVHEERATFLETAFATKCVYDYSRHFGKEKTKKGALFYKPEFHQWVLLRGVRLSSLASFPRCELVPQHKRALIKIIRASGACLKTVKTYTDFGTITVALYTHCTVLERLECGKVGKRRGLDRLLEACPSLQHLALESTDASALKVLQEFGSQIRSLRMTSDKFSLQRPRWANLVPHLPNLTDLEVGTKCPHDTVLTAVGAHCPLLRSLKITSYKTSGPGGDPAAILAVAKGCPNLETLHAEGSLYITGTVWLELLQRCRKLTAIHSSSLLLFSSAGLATVLARNFPALRELGVKYTGNSGSDNLSTLSTQHIASWPSLEVLNLGSTPLSDELLHALGAHCPRLRSVTSSFCPTITDASVTALAKGCPMLENVYLGHCPNITVAALGAITTHCRRLEGLSIHQANAPNGITREEAQPYLNLKLGDINAYAFQDSLAQQNK